ncbi:hypothetical protein GGF32_007388 [Allomyces javanicus]|nr:hypothetical protein GGF32_007388 [Allomyces javanicus]
MASDAQTMDALKAVPATAAAHGSTAAVETAASLVPRIVPNAPMPDGFEAARRSPSLQSYSASSTPTTDTMPDENAMPDSDSMEERVLAASDKEKEKERLAARLGRRPSKVDLKLRNIIRVDSSDSIAGAGKPGTIQEEPMVLHQPPSIKERSSQLKGCLKKRPERTELVEKNILKEVNNVDASLTATADQLKRAQLTDTLNSHLAARPMPAEVTSKLGIKFDETVEVLPTFRKTEYNRKPDTNATFRKLTPRMKMEIREELNQFKKNEMSVHEQSLQNTAFH